MIPAFFLAFIIVMAWFVVISVIADKESADDDGGWGL